VSGVPEVDALIARAVAIANGILQGEIDAYSGAKRLWLVRTELAAIEEALRVFAGLASEWEDEPDHRDAYERDILVAADRFRARWEQ
jgi:hypothetical protein